MRQFDNTLTFAVQWQRKLSGLASTLDKCLQRLESRTSEKMESINSPRYRSDAHDHDKDIIFKPAVDEKQKLYNVSDRSSLDNSKNMRDMKGLTPLVPSTEQNGQNGQNGRSAKLEAEVPDERKAFVKGRTRSLPSSNKELRSIPPKHVEKMRTQFNDCISDAAKETRDQAMGKMQKEMNESDEKGRYSFKSINHLRDDKPAAKPRAIQQKSPDRCNTNTPKPTVDEGFESDKTSTRNHSHHFSGYCRLPQRNNEAGLDEVVAKNWKSTWSGNLSYDDNDSSGKHTFVSSYSHPLSHRRTQSVPGPVVQATDANTERDGTGPTVTSTRHSSGRNPRHATKITDITPRSRSRTEPTLPETDVVVQEQDKEILRTCHNSRRCGDVSADVPSVRPRTLRSSPPPATAPRFSSFAVQCDIVSNDEVQKAEEQLERLKVAQFLMIFLWIWCEAGNFFKYMRTFCYVPSAWASEGGAGGAWPAPWFWNYWQKRLFFQFWEVKNKFHRFWPSLENFWENPLLPPPGKIPADTHDQVCSFVHL